MNILYNNHPGRSLNVLFTIFFLLSSPAAFAADSAFEQATWIGFTAEQRPAEFAERSILFVGALSEGPKPGLMPKKVRTFPAPLLRKKFVVTKLVRSAQVQVCGVGLYEFHLNGKKVGDRVLDPAQTSYNKRAFYVVHDVTNLLQIGDNAIGLMLGNGFYGQNVAFNGGLAYGEPRAKLTLTMTYTDGATTVLATDDSWKVTQGPVLFDNIYAGETFDARLMPMDWAQASFDDSTWVSAQTMKAPTTTVIEQELEPMRKIRSLTPIAVMPANNGEWILDMGQNLTGWLQIRVREAAGTKIQLRFAEHLMPDRQTIDTASTGVHVTGSDQTDIYLCNGTGVEEWEPRFTYHGFRYVQISGLSTKPEAQDYTGWLVRTDVARIGSFASSDPLLNKFYAVSMWTIEDNLQGLLSDCPHRERCAWMGDNHVVAEAMSYNFDLRKFWPKVSTDIDTVLGVEGPAGKRTVKMPRDPRAPGMIAVGKRLCGQATADWGAATVLLPWFNYIYYGDLETVKTAWPTMTGWMAYLAEFGVRDGIVADGLGDWCPPGSNKMMDTPEALTSTALYYQSLTVMTQMARALGKHAESTHYAATAERIQKAFISKFYRPVEHDFGSQTGTAVALHVGLAPAGAEQLVGDGLAALVMGKAGGHYTTGMFGHRPLYTMLNDFGHSAVTKHLWTITEWPSLGFMTETHGLTTWPEVPLNWPVGERYHPNSFNHPMNSGFAAVFHESLGGIRPDPEHPGFKKFFLRPCFVPDVAWVKVGHRSPLGEISSYWRRDGENIIWEVTVPAASSARVQLLAYGADKIQLGGQPVASNTFELSPGTWSVRVAP